MRYILIFWLAPIGLFWGWYFLSYYDMNFGSIYLSRALHDLVFKIYGDILGLDPAIIPGLVAKAFAIDTLLIFAIFAFRRRRVVAERYARLRQRWSGEGASEEPAPSS